MTPEKLYGDVHFQRPPFFEYNQSYYGGPNGFAYANEPPHGSGNFVGQPGRFNNSSNGPPNNPRNRFEFNGPTQRFNGPSREYGHRFDFPNGEIFPRGFNSPPHRFGGMPPFRFNGQNMLRNNGPPQRFNGPSREFGHRFDFPFGPPRGYYGPADRFGGMPPAHFNGPNMPLIEFNEPCPPYPHHHVPLHVANSQIGPNGLPQNCHNQLTHQQKPQELNGSDISPKSESGKKKKRKKKKKKKKTEGATSSEATEAIEVLEADEACVDVSQNDP